VAPKYLGLDERTAKARAARAKLLFPAFRAGSQKGQWLVAATDFAEHLDRERDKAKKEWAARNH
jgi:hypothetical protein